VVVDRRNKDNIEQLFMLHAVTCIPYQKFGRAHSRALKLVTGLPQCFSAAASVHLWLIVHIPVRLRY